MMWALCTKHTLSRGPVDESGSMQAARTRTQAHEPSPLTPVMPVLSSTYAMPV
jgi:hypothetical protein